MSDIQFDISIDGKDGESKSFDSNSVTIGKGAAATLQIDDASIADLAAVMQIGDDGMTLMDLMGGAGEIQVNGEALAAGPQAIEFGAEIKIGNSVLTLVDPNAPAEEPAADEEVAADDSPGQAAAAAAIATDSLDAFDTMDSTEAAYMEQGEAALDFLMRSGQADSDLGVDRKAAPWLEVATVWNDTVTDVKHFDRNTRSVTIGDEMGRPRFSWNKIIDFAYGAYFTTVQRADFFLDSGELPGDSEFELVRGDGKTWFVQFSSDFNGYFENKDDDTKVTLKELVASGRAQKDGKGYKAAIQPGERAVIDVGDVLFFVQEVHRAKVAPVPWTSGLDVAFSGIMGILALVATVGLFYIASGDYDPKLDVQPLPDRFVDMMIQEQEKPPDVKKPEKNPDAGEGAKAKGEEGKVGRKESKLKKAKGAKVAVNKAKMDKEIAQSAGLLADLQTNDSSLFGTGGLDASVTSALGGLSGVIGSQYGSGGLGSRGSGLGGGGTAEGLGGLGTKGRGSGGSGYGKGAGYYGKKGSGEPGVGRGSPIVLGALDKSIIDRVVKQHLSEIRYCYQKELNKNPKLSGRISVKFTIAADGSVSSSSIKSSSLNNSVAESCIAGRFRRFRFPKPKGGGIVVVSYPFTFKAAQ